MGAAAEASQGGWRPWHAYSNMAWAQVKQNKMEVTAAMTTDLFPARPPTDQMSRTVGSTPFGGTGTPQTDQMSRTVGSTPFRSGTGSGTGSPKQQMSRSAGSFGSSTVRPRWNHRLATSNPNWPDANGIARRPKFNREPFSKSQSMADLRTHFLENPQCKQNMREVEKPEIYYHKQSKYSNDRVEVRQGPELLPTRSKYKHGRMKDPTTGQKTHWEDNWQSPPQLKHSYVAGTNNFRCPGAPPRWMYVDEYEDKED